MDCVALSMSCIHSRRVNEPNVVFVCNKGTHLVDREDSFRAVEDDAEVLGLEVRHTSCPRKSLHMHRLHFPPCLLQVRVVHGRRHQELNDAVDTQIPQRLNERVVLRVRRESTRIRRTCLSVTRLKERLILCHPRRRSCTSESA